MDAVSDRFIEDATRGLRFLLRALAPTPGEVFLERVMGAHCNGSGHVPGCPNGAGGEGVPKYELLSKEAARKEAEEALMKIAGKPITNNETGITANVSGDSLKKIVSGNALGTTFRNLVDTGYCDKDTAYRIHMTAAAHIGELFETARSVEKEEVYHEVTSREEARHALSSFHVQGMSGTLDADISIIKYFTDDGRRIYSLGIEIRRPR